jgi:predicted nucleic acid-binding protein
VKIILDTNAYVAFKRGHDAVVDRVRNAHRVVFSTVVAGELIFGFRHGSRLAENMEELARFLDNPYVETVPVTITTADRFGRVAAGLRRKGSPIPTNDIWIAAHAFETGAELLSFDRHFERIDGLVWTRLK